MNVIVSSIAKKVGVICPKETKEMDPDESCCLCIHFQFCFDAVMLAMGVKSGFVVGSRDLLEV